MANRWPNVRSTVGPPSGQPDKRYFSWHLVGTSVGQTLMLNDAAMLGQRRAYMLAQRLGDFAQLPWANVIFQRWANIIATLGQTLYQRMYVDWVAIRLSQNKFKISIFSLKYRRCSVSK